jgi:hypothetical protein
MSLYEELTTEISEPITSSQLHEIGAKYAEQKRKDKIKQLVINMRKNTLDHAKHHVDIPEYDHHLYGDHIHSVEEYDKIMKKRCNEYDYISDTIQILQKLFPDSEIKDLYVLEKYVRNDKCDNPWVPWFRVDAKDIISFRSAIETFDFIQHHNIYIRRYIIVDWSKSMSKSKSESNLAKT